MKHLEIALLALCTGLAAAVPLRFTADVTKAATFQATAYRGETLEIEAALTDRGTALTNGAPAAMYWQTNGMGSAWWTAPAAMSGGVIRATWSPTNDVGAAAYRVFLGVTDGGLNYRANMTLRMTGSPGSTPNALPLPTHVLDFAAVSVANAASSPFELRGEGGAVSSVNSQTGAVVLTAANITMADGDRVVEVELNNAMTAAMNAQGQAALAEQTANGAMAAAVTAQATADGKLAATWATGYAAAAVIYAAGTYPIVDESGASVTIENHRRTSVTASGAVSLSIDRTAGDFDAVLVLDIQAGATISWVGVTNGLSVFQPKGGKALEYEAGKKYLIGITRIGYNAIAISKQELETL